MDIQEVLNWTDEQVFAKTGKHLESLQKSILEGIWQHQDYQEIAQNNERSYDHVKKEAWKLWKLLSDVIGEDVKKSNVFSVLEQAELSATGNSTNFMQIALGNNHVNICGEQQRSPSDPSSPSSTSTENRSPIIDLTDAPELTDFYDRTTELSTLKQWILKDQTRSIAIYGFSEIGKSALTLKLIEQIHNQFDYIIWRSLSNLPKLSVLKTELKEFFSQSQPNPLPTVLDYFRNSRCLVILDDLQTIFQSGQLAGEYLTEYKDYGKFFKQIARNHHQSCVILLSWEKSRDLATLEGENRPARTLHLKGLESDAEEILRDRGLTDEERWPELINLYQGHPTWLNIIASTILELFDGRVSLFLGNPPQPDGVGKGGLKEKEIFIGDLSPLLESQLDRLSELEKKVISRWSEDEALEISRQPGLSEISQSELWSAMQSLGRRGLVEKVTTGERGLFQINRILQEYIKL